MAKRIEVDLDSTKQLVATILMEVVIKKERIQFLVPAGQADSVLARVRTHISRTRNTLRNRGKKAKHFRLRSTVHAETHEGKRMDAIVLWEQQDDSNLMMEIFEDLNANG